MIREAKQTDIPELIELAIEALKSDSYPELTIDRNRVYLQVTNCVISKTNFAWVSEVDGKIVGALGAVTAPHAFYEKNQAVVIMWYCKKHGDGMKLMKSFLEWVLARKSVNHIEYSLPQRAGGNMVKQLHKLGFNGLMQAMYILR